MRHGARVLMHEAPLATCNIIAFGGLRCSFRLPPEELGYVTSPVTDYCTSPGQFCRSYSRYVSSAALVSLFHRSVANSFRCCATGSDSLLLPRVQCCLKECLVVYVVAHAVRSSGISLLLGVGDRVVFFSFGSHDKKRGKKTNSPGRMCNTLKRADF